MKTSYSDTVSLLSAFSRLDTNSQKELIDEIIPISLFVTYLFLLKENITQEYTGLFEEIDLVVKDHFKLIKAMYYYEGITTLNNNFLLRKLGVSITIGFKTVNDILTRIKKLDINNSKFDPAHANFRQKITNSIIQLKRLCHEVRRYNPRFINEIDILDFYKDYLISTRNSNSRITNQSGLFILYSPINESKTGEEDKN